MCDEHVPPKKDDIVENIIETEYKGNPYPRKKKDTHPQIKPGQEVLSNFIGGK
jgi:hypothetical protein